MCRNIKTLFNDDPPASKEEIRASALQYVRKVSGFWKPSRVNREPFERAVDQIAQQTEQLLSSLETAAPPRDRGKEAARSSAKAAAGHGREAG